MALFQISVALSLAVGAALGGVVVEQFGFATIFLVSGIGRLVGAILLWRFVRPHTQPEAKDGEGGENPPMLPEGALGLVSGGETVEGAEPLDALDEIDPVEEPEPPAERE